MHPRSEYDYLIVGAGLAGQLLARALAKRGQKVCLSFDPRQTGASRVAAWMINPITGIRFVPSWRVDVFLPEALRLYRELEEESGLVIWHPATIHRLFQGEDEIPRWRKKRVIASVQKYLGREFETSPDLPGVEHFGGGITINGGGWANLRPWLEYALKHPAPGIEVIERNVTRDELLHSHLTLENRVFRRVIFCTGFGNTNLPWKPAKGELLTVSIPDLNLRDILLRGIFVIPLGGDLYRVGATYEWEDLTNGSTEKGVGWLKNKLEKLIPLPFTIVDSQGAVRPILRDARPVVGLDLADPRFGIFNGLGSKAALMAPSIAEHFASHLMDGTPLDAELDWARC